MGYGTFQCGCSYCTKLKPYCGIVVDVYNKRAHSLLYEHIENAGYNHTDKHTEWYYLSIDDMNKLDNIISLDKYIKDQE